MRRSSLKQVLIFCVAMLLVGSLAFGMGESNNSGKADSNGSGDIATKDTKSNGDESMKKTDDDAKSISKAKAKRDAENVFNSREYRR